MSTTTILVIISVAIVLLLFSIGGYYYKRSEKLKNEALVQNEKKIKEINLKQMNHFFKEEVKGFFVKYREDYVKVDVDTNVSELNKKYKDDLEKLINTAFVKAILSIEDSEFYVEANFLYTLQKESPFVWNKKFEKEIKEYYG